MAAICMTDPLGSLPDFSSLLTFPPALPNINIPALTLVIPTLPQPLLPNIDMPNFDIQTIALELQTAQLMQTVMGMIQPMLSLLGTSLDSFLPAIPQLPGITLIDLMAGNPQAIIAAIEAKIAAQTLPPLPGVPNPLYPTLNVPTLQAYTSFQAIVRNYMQTIAQMVPALIDSVISKLHLHGVSLPAVPTIPSADDLMAMVLAAIPPLPGIPPIPGIPSIPSFAELTAMLPSLDFSIADIFANLTIPGFPAMPRLPSPLIPSIDAPEVELNMALQALNTYLSSAMLKVPMDFITNTLSKYLSFTFPVLCVDISVPTIPTP